MTPEEETHRRAEIRASAEQYVTDCLAILGQQMPATRDFVAIVHKVEEPVLRAWGLKPCKQLELNRVNAELAQLELNRVEAELAAIMTTEDGTWGRAQAVISYSDGTPDQLMDADQAIAISQEANQDWREMCVRLRAQLAALRAKYDAITRDAISGIETVPSVEHYYEGLLDKREAELAALRPVAEAAVAWEKITAETDQPRVGTGWPKEIFRADQELREAVRALPPEWREGGKE